MEFDAAGNKVGHSNYNKWKTRRFRELDKQMGHAAHIFAYK